MTGQPRDEIALVASIGAVARANGVRPEQITGRSREPKIVELRRIVIEGADAQGYTSTQIGRVLGRHHTTVLHYLGRTGRERREGDDT